MNLSRCRAIWDAFFYREIPAYSLGLFRITFGVVVFLAIALLWPDALVWYGDRGTLPTEVARGYLQGARLNLLLLLHPSNVVVYLFLAGTLAAAAMLTVGYRTRIASVAVWACLVSLHHRDIYILNSGDHLLRTLSFFLMFAPAGKAYSIDRYLRIRRGLEQPGVPMMEIWPQRLLQLQVCIMYASTALWKLQGHAWYDGTAVYYITHLVEFHRFPTPAWIHSLWFSQLATWSAMGVEVAMATLIWYRPFRKPVLCAGMLLHLGLEYTMNIPVFQWVVLASYIVFLDDFAGFRTRWVKRPLTDAERLADDFMPKRRQRSPLAEQAPVESHR